MKLSVIIPCYKESPTTAINSIKNQVGYNPDDVEIILSMDLPGKSPKHSGVKTVTTDTNTGPGQARQRGLDIATGEYVTFLDADDIWFNSLAYMLFLRDVYEVKPNIAKFGILEQGQNNELNQIQSDCTWCFGKMFRREFLIENNIRFHPELRVHEDSYFVRLAELYTPQALIHQDLIYLWAYNPDSIVRRNNGIYWQSEFETYIKVLLMLRDERIKLGMEYDGCYDIAYCYSMISCMDDEYSKPCIALLKSSGENWAAYMEQYERLVYCWKQAIAHKNAPLLSPKMTLDEFMRSVCNET